MAEVHEKWDADEGAFSCVYCNLSKSNYYFFKFWSEITEKHLKISKTVFKHHGNNYTFIPRVQKYVYQTWLKSSVSH